MYTSCNRGLLLFKLNILLINSSVAKHGDMGKLKLLKLYFNIYMLQYLQKCKPWFRWLSYVFTISAMKNHKNIFSILDHVM